MALDYSNLPRDRFAFGHLEIEAPATSSPTPAMTSVGACTMLLDAHSWRAMARLLKEESQHD